RVGGDTARAGAVTRGICHVSSLLSEKGEDLFRHRGGIVSGMRSSESEVPNTARGELLQQMRVWQKRRRIAFFVRVVTIIVALTLAAPAVVLLLGQITTMRDDYVPQRHAPGTDGSISITVADSYVLVKHQAELPPCTITDAEGYE